MPHRVARNSNIWCSGSHSWTKTATDPFPLMNCSRHCLKEACTLACRRLHRLFGVFLCHSCPAECGHPEKMHGHDLHHHPTESICALCRMYDPASTGVVDFAGFERMHNFILQTQENFKIIDRNGDGKLSRTEVETALEQAGMSNIPVTSFARFRRTTMSSYVTSHISSLSASHLCRFQSVSTSIRIPVCSIRSCMPGTSRHARLCRPDDIPTVCQRDV